MQSRWSDPESREYIDRLAPKWGEDMALRVYTSRLIGRDNVILTPHTAFYSVEALAELQSKCAADVARVLSGETPVYPVKAA